MEYRTLSFDDRKDYQESVSEKVRSIRLVLRGWIMIEAKAARGQ